MSTLPNPFFVMNLGAESIERVQDFRVDRDEEFSVCRVALLERHHNVLLYGERGVGKTFLIRLLSDELRKHENVFHVPMRLSGLNAYGAGDAAASFSRAVLLEFCAALWTQVLGKSYLELRDRLDETGQEITLRNDAERTIQKVYSHLMTSHVQARHDLTASVGFSIGAKGEKRESSAREYQQVEILPFEFLEFTDELIQKVLKPAGKTRIIILCDEANLMPLFTQEQILDRYLQLFSTRKVQFLFSAGLMAWDAKPNLPMCFETRVELNGFAEKRHVIELISKLNSTVVQFTEEAIDLIYSAFRGHPRDTISACQQAFDIAAEKPDKSVNASVVHAVYMEIKERQESAERMMKRQMNE